MVRKLTADDREVFMELADAFHSSPAVLNAIPKETVIQNFEEAIKDGPYLDGYLIEHEAEPAGFAMVTKSHATAVGGQMVWIEDVYIKPDMRGKGIGQNFFEFVTTRYSGAKRFRLEVAPANHKAAKLYDRLGFEKLDYTQMILDI